ncbi:heavy-metal-associated domain-containing protein [bacterium]|nr:MAG: heavy-metal-associated domain-containing protein [bacterium]
MKTNLQIEGMSCEACVRFVAMALQSIDGVDRAMVDLNSKRAEVEGDNYRVEDLIEAVEEEGYSAKVEA